MKKGHGKSVLLLHFTSVCGKMLSQIAAMTSMHHTSIQMETISLKSRTIPCCPCRRPDMARPVWSCQVVGLSKHRGPCYQSHPPVSQSVECQLIRLFSSLAGSSFSVPWRSGLKQHCVCLAGTKAWIEYTCHNKTMKANRRNSQIKNNNTRSIKVDKVNRQNVWEPLA